MKEFKRVVITGRGAISSLGSNITDLVKNIAAGKCGIQYMPKWEEVGGLRSRIGAPALLNDVKSIPRGVRRSMGKSSLMTAQAAKEAVADSNLTENDLTTGRAGCVIGATIGSTEAFAEAFRTVFLDKSLAKMSSTQLFKSMSHAEAMNLSQYLKINGVVMSTPAACASSLVAIGTASDLIRMGKQDIMLCGGCEEIGPLVTGCFDILYATSTKYQNEPLKSSRPFDRDRDGLVCGEGSGVLVLEDYDRAVKRGAHIYGEILGYSTCASASHISQSDKASMVRCFNNTLKDAEVSPDKIDYICAHATATIHGDVEEVKAIKEIFGSEVPVNGLKGHLGHTMGGSGAIELAVNLSSLENGIIYPTLNLENIDPECDGIMHVREPIERKITCMMKNSFAFGGINATIIVKKI